jgi:hypothetical protein
VREDLAKEGMDRPRKAHKRDLDNTNAPEKLKKVEKVGNSVELGERRKAKRSISVSM